MLRSLTIAAATIAIALLLAATACGGDGEKAKPANYGYEEGTTAPVPGTATRAQEDYADCMLKSYGITNHGWNSIDNVHIWRIQRCRLLEPPSLGITSTQEVQECLHEYGPWIAHRHRLEAFPKGWAGTIALTATETICAPESGLGK